MSPRAIRLVLQRLGRGLHPRAGLQRSSLGSALTRGTFVVKRSNGCEIFKRFSSEGSSLLLNRLT